MKRGIVAVLFCMVLVGAATGQVRESTDRQKQDNPLAGIRMFLSAGIVFPVGFVIYTGVEYAIGSWVLGETMFISVGFGAASQVALASWPGRWSYLTLGAGLLAASSISFGNKLFVSLYPGVGANYYFFAGDPSYFTNREKTEIGFAGLASVRYRFTEKIAAGVDFSYWTEYIGPNLGIGLQLAFR